MKRIIKAALLLAALHSCSVKEERIPCPCILRLDMSGCIHFREGTTVYLNTEDGLLRQYHYPESSPLELEFELPKGDVIVSVVNSGDTDSLFAGSEHIRLEDEFNYFAPSLKKQFASIELDPVLLLGDGRPYVVRITASSSGLDPVTLNPNREALDRVFLPRADGRCIMTVPRQSDDSLSMSIVCLDDGMELEYPLGQLLRDRIFDWTSEDLSDVSVKLGPIDAGIRITVSGWDL